MFPVDKHKILTQNIASQNPEDDMRASPPPIQPAQGSCSYIEVFKKRCSRSNIFDDEEPVNANMSDEIRWLRQGARIQRITTIVQESQRKAPSHSMEPFKGRTNNTSQMMDACGDILSSFYILKPETEIVRAEKVDGVASNDALEPKSWAAVLMSKPPPVRIERKALVVIGKIKPASQQVDDNNSAVKIQDNSANDSIELSSKVQWIADKDPQYVSGTLMCRRCYYCGGESEDESAQLEWIFDGYKSEDEKMDYEHIESLEDTAKGNVLGKVILKKRPKVWITVARTEYEDFELRGGGDDDEEGDDDETYFTASEEDERAHGATAEIGENKDEDSVADDDHPATPTIGSPVRCTIGLYHDALCDVHQVTIRAAVLTLADATLSDQSTSIPHTAPKANPLQDIGGLLTDNEEAEANSLTQLIANLPDAPKGKPASTLGSAVSSKTKVANPKANTDEIELRGGGYADLYYSSSGANIRSVSKEIKSPKKTPTSGRYKRIQDRTELDEMGAAEVLLGLAVELQNDVEGNIPVKRPTKMPSLLEEFRAAEELLLLSMSCQKVDQEGVSCCQSPMVPLWLAAPEHCTAPKAPGDMPPLYSISVVKNNQVSYCRTTSSGLEIRGGAGNISPYWAFLRTLGRHRSGSRANGAPELTLSQALANRAGDDAAAEVLVQLENSPQRNLEEVTPANGSRMMSTWLDGLESSIPTDEYSDSIEEPAASAAEMQSMDAKKTMVAVALRALGDALNPDAPLVPTNTTKSRPPRQKQLKKKKSKKTRIKKWLRKALKLDEVQHEKLADENAEAEPMLLPQLRGGSTAQRAKQSRLLPPNLKHGSFLGLDWAEVGPNPLLCPDLKSGTPICPVLVTNSMEEEWEDTDWEDTDPEPVPSSGPGTKPDHLPDPVPVVVPKKRGLEDSGLESAPCPGPDPKFNGPQGPAPVNNQVTPKTCDGEPDPVLCPGPDPNSEGPTSLVPVKHRMTPGSKAKTKYVVKRPCQGLSSLYCFQGLSRLSFRGNKVPSSQTRLGKLELAGSTPQQIQKSLWLKRQVKIRPWHSILHEDLFLLPSTAIKKPRLKLVEPPPPPIGEVASLSAEAELVKAVQDQTLQKSLELDAIQEKLIRTYMEKGTADEVCASGVACNGCQRRFKNTVKLLYHLGCSITGARTDRLIRAAYKTGHLCPAVISKLQLAAWPYDFTSISMPTNSLVYDTVDWLKRNPILNMPSSTRDASDDWKTVKSPTPGTALSSFSSRGPLGFFDGKVVTFIYPSGFRSEHETGQLQADTSLMSLKPESVLIPLRLHRAQTAVHVAAMNPNFNIHALVVFSSYLALSELKCEGCGDYFPSGNMLLRHLGWRNNEDKTIMVGELEFLCPAMLLQKGNEELICNCCKLTYPNEVQLYKHLRGTLGTLRRSWRLMANGALMPLAWRNRVPTAKLWEKDTWEVPLAEFVDKIDARGLAPSEPVRPIDSRSQLKLNLEACSLKYQAQLPVADAYSTSDETGDFSARGRSRTTSMEVSSHGSSDADCADACEHEEHPWTQVAKKKNRQRPQQNAKRKGMMTSLDSIPEEEVRHRSTNCGNIYAIEEHLHQHWGSKGRCRGACRNELVTKRVDECGACFEVFANRAVFNEHWVGKCSREARKTATMQSERRGDLSGGDVPLDCLTTQEKAAFVEVEENERNEKIQEWVMNVPEEQTTVELWNCEGVKQMAIPIVSAGRPEAHDALQIAVESSATKDETCEPVALDYTVSVGRGRRMTISSAAGRVKSFFGNINFDLAPDVSLPDMTGAEIVSHGSEERTVTPDREDGYSLPSHIIKSKPKTRRGSTVPRETAHARSVESLAVKISTIGRVAAHETIYFGDIKMEIEPRRPEKGPTADLLPTENEGL